MLVENKTDILGLNIETYNSNLIEKNELRLRLYYFVKRITDITGSLAGIIIFFPAALLISIIIKLESRGPVLYKQKRVGRNNREFVIYKFRSMCLDADCKKKALLPFNEQPGPAFKLKNDPRITKFGRFLRKSSMDELPQFINILKGEMSLVGPRPLDVNEAFYLENWQKERHYVKPGLTCYWQVETRNTVTFDEWMFQDICYIKINQYYLIVN